MGVYEKYLSFDKQISEYAKKGDFVNSELKVKESVAFRNGNFSKADWEQLISESEGRAKYEYTRMMKERYPD
ncbi:MAG TPA: hypothetical protein DEV87_02480 [Clostridiales bacterium]|nr:hypothetical protein [Clostridiales bacterium]